MKKIYPEKSVFNIAEAIRSFNDMSSLYRIIDMAGEIKKLPSHMTSLWVEGRVNRLTIFCSSYKTDLDHGPFHDCGNLYEVDMPNLNSLVSMAFVNCENLTTVRIPNASYIEENAFGNSLKLKEIYTGSVFCSLENSYVFDHMRRWSVYVPAELYSMYIADENWSYFSSRIVSYSTSTT